MLKASRTGVFIGSGYSMSLFLGANTEYSQTYCNDARITEVQYFGVLDELRVFNDELTEDDIYTIFMT